MLSEVGSMNAVVGNTLLDWTLNITTATGLHGETLSSMTSVNCMQCAF